MVYVALIVLVATQVVLFRTRLACAYGPWRASAGRGHGRHHVYVLRYGAVITAGYSPGLRGAFCPSHRQHIRPGHDGRSGYIAWPP